MENSAERFKKSRGNLDAGLAFLHGQGIFYKKLEVANILLCVENGYLVPKLGDLHLAEKGGWEGGLDDVADVHQILSKLSGGKEGFSRKVVWDSWGLEESCSTLQISPGKAVFKCRRGGEEVVVKEYDQLEGDTFSYSTVTRVYEAIRQEGRYENVVIPWETTRYRKEGALVGAEILPFCKGGELFDLLHRYNRQPNLQQVIQMGKQIFAGFLNPLKFKRLKQKLTPQLREKGENTLESICEV